MPFFNVLSFVVSQQLAADEGITDPARRTFYGLLGGILATPVGLGVTLALANQEAEQNPPPVQPAPLTITTTFLPVAVDGQPYSTTLNATGGTPSYTWGVAAGGFPPSGNISLSPTTGIISGTPDAGGADDGTFGLVIQVTDSAQPPNTQTQPLVLQVSRAAPAVQKKKP